MTELIKLVNSATMELRYAVLAICLTWILVSIIDNIVYWRVNRCRE